MTWHPSYDLKEETLMGEQIRGLIGRHPVAAVTVLVLVVLACIRERGAVAETMEVIAIVATVAAVALAALVAFRWIRYLRNRRSTPARQEAPGPDDGEYDPAPVNWDAEFARLDRGRSWRP